MPEVRWVMSYGLVVNFILFSAMQKFWKSVKIWQSYRELNGGNFLRHSVVILTYLLSCLFALDISTPRSPSHNSDVPNQSICAAIEAGWVHSTYSKLTATLESMHYLDRACMNTVLRVKDSWCRTQCSIQLWFIMMPPAWRACAFLAVCLSHTHMLFCGVIMRSHLRPSVCLSIFPIRALTFLTFKSLKS